VIPKILLAGVRPLIWVQFEQKRRVKSVRTDLSVIFAAEVSIKNHRIEDLRFMIKSRRKVIKLLHVRI
jgi:hypothetical protein